MANSASNNESHSNTIHSSSSQEGLSNSDNVNREPPMKTPFNNDTSEKTIHEQPAHQTPPNGGLDAWLHVLAAFLAFFSTWGLTQTYGAFQAYYENINLSRKSSSEISWNGSLQCFLVVITGFIAGPLFDLGYLRQLMFLGSFLLVFGNMMLSLCDEYYQVILAQGLCTGLGGGLIYVPALAIVSTQFSSKRSLAVGIASTGSNIGGIIFPLMFRHIQANVGFGWAVRAIGFVNLGILTVSLAILGRRKQVVPAKKRTLKTVFDLQALKEPTFVSFALALFFIFVGFYVPLFYIPLFAQNHLRTSDDLAYNILAIVNAGSFAGRILPFLTSKIPPIYSLAFWSAGCAVLLFCWITIDNTAGFIIFSVLYGFGSGVLVAGCSSAVAHKTLSPNLSVIGARLGLSWAFASIGVLIGTPIAGAAADVQSGAFLGGQAFSGAVMIAAALSLVLPVYKVMKYRGEQQ